MNASSPGCRTLLHRVDHLVEHLALDGVERAAQGRQRRDLRRKAAQRGCGPQGPKVSKSMPSVLHEPSTCNREPVLVSVRG